MIDPVLHADQAPMSREVAALARTAATCLFTTAGKALSLSDLFKNEQAQASRLPA